MSKKGAALMAAAAAHRRARTQGQGCVLVRMRICMHVLDVRRICVGARVHMMHATPQLCFCKLAIWC